MPPVKPVVRDATTADHPALLALAKASRHTKDFGHVMFSGPDAYARGWIRLAERRGQVLGFICYRVKVRSPENKIYYVAVAEGVRGGGVGRLLVEDLEGRSAGRTVALDCEKDNDRACGFYEHLGYVCTGESLGGKGWRYEKSVPGQPGTLL